MSNVVITMAGMGRRFRDAGYACPKYCIEAHGRTLFAWSMLSLKSFINAGARFSFVVLKQDKASAFIRRECAALGIGVGAIVELEQLTDGQATSALLCGATLPDPQQPLLIYNIDTLVHPDALPASAVRGRGWIPCFAGQGEGWSFARAGGDGRIVELREKVRISPHATIGLYWFASFDLYRRTYDSYYADARNMERGEKYIAPMYNQMIQDNEDIYLHEVAHDMVTPLGTPAEVDSFLRKKPPAIPAGSS